MTKMRARAAPLVAVLMAMALLFAGLAVSASVKGRAPAVAQAAASSTMVAPAARAMEGMTASQDYTQETATINHYRQSAGRRPAKHPPSTGARAAVAKSAAYKTSTNVLLAADVGTVLRA